MICVSVATVASLISPNEMPVLQNNITDYSITKQACPKSKLNKVENNRICLKNGKVYRWATKKPIPVLTPTPTKTTTPTTTTTSIPNNTVESKKNESENSLIYTVPSELNDDIETCKIKEVKQQGPRNGSSPGGGSTPLPSGFPRLTPSTQHIGTVKWALIPIDFSDLKGESNFRSRVDSQMELLTDWYFTVSESKFKIDWSVHNNWVTLPKPSSQYTIKSSVNLADSETGQTLFRDAIASSDPVFDFTNIQYVIFLLPKGQTFLEQTSQGFPWDKLVIDTKTNEGKISGFAIPGFFMDYPGKQYWSYWAHEFGHAISLSHIGASRGGFPPFNAWDVMGSQDATTKELSGWLRWLSGWMSDEQVYCKNASNINNSLSATLIPLSENKKGIKLIVIPISNTKAVLVESRRETKFSCTTKKPRNGILVYLYDANLSHGENFLVPLYNLRTNREFDSCSSLTPTQLPQTVDVIMYEGEALTYAGITIKVEKSSNLDKITIKKQS